jgi:hypothetical protein
MRHRKAAEINAKVASGDIDAVDLGMSVSILAADAEKKGPRRFEMLAYNGGPLTVDNYPAPVVVDLDGLEFRYDQVPIYFGHHDGSDGTRLVGHTNARTKDGGKLTVSGLISASTQYASQVIDAHDNGYKWQASVGLRPDAAKLETVKAGQSVRVNGKTFTGPLIVARKSMLRHIAILPEGADSQTSVSIAANAATKEEVSMDFKEWLNALFGGAVPELTDKQQATLQARFNDEKTKAPAIEGKAAGAPVPEFDLSACQLLHAKHVATIEAKTAEYATKVPAEKRTAIMATAGEKAATIKLAALNESWPAARLEVALVKAQCECEGELVKATFSKAPAIHASNRDTSSEVIEAAFCQAAGLRGVEKAFKPEVLGAADVYRRRDGVSLQGMILAAAEQSGYGGSRRIHRGNYDEVMRSALPILASAPSSHTLTTMLTTVGNKFLLEGFMEVEQVWRQLCSVRPVNDFKSITSYRMLDDMEFKELGPAGTIEHGTASQESYTNQAKTYARMFALTRADIINDDLGAFDSIRDRIGHGCGTKLNSVFWAKFLDDATFFNATAVSGGGHANLLTTALSEAGISAANVLLKAQTDGNGHPLAYSGRHLLLTGATLSPTARRWYVSQEVRDTTASTKTPTANIYQNVFQPVESAYITSTTAWYLLPIGASSMAPMEVCFLDGVQAPTIESADADFNTLGIQFRGYFDFGTAQKEWRVSVKSTGAG